MTTSSKSRALRLAGKSRVLFPAESFPAKSSEHHSAHALSKFPVRAMPHTNQRRPLCVMKFGGTSVGNAGSILKVVEIIREASRNSDVIVVVSALGGVTNRLLEAASAAEHGDRMQVASIFDELRKRHAATAAAIIRSAADRERLARHMQEVFLEGDRLCQGTILLRELTLRARDSISSLGERLSAPLIAMALSGSGVASEPVESSTLIVTNSNHGAADPWMDLTTERCESQLRPLLQQGIVPVVTGFIGATAEGVLTTLGRGGSDYSASILGAALGSDEITIWTDVDGMLTADPRIVPGACTIPEMSYREAAELAYFGARVLHPKTLRAITQSGIPVWIRNTFAADRPGTRITPAGSPRSRGVKAVTAVGDVSLITVGGKGMIGIPDMLGRTFAATAMAHANILVISHSSSQNDICLVVAAADARRTADALRLEFAPDLVREEEEHVTIDENVRIVTVVGQDMRGISGIVGRVFGTLGRKNVNVIAIAQGTSDCNLSFVVAQKDVPTALLAIHREFRLGSRSRASQMKTLPSIAKAAASP